MDAHLRDLRSFVAVAEELHFTRAAERLFISQPALSRQIAKLERDLRVDLLRRDRRSVEMTAAGATLLTEARRLLARWDSAQRNVSDAAAHEDAVLRIGQQTSIGRGVVESIASGIRTRRPAWRIEISQVPWTDPTAGLAQGTTDVALCWLPLPDPDRYRSVVLTSEPVMVAIAADHPLAGAGEVAFASIEDLALVALPAEAGVLRSFWLAAHARGGRPPPVAGVATTADEALETVGAGLGGVLIAAGNARIYQRPGVAFVPVVDLPSADLALVWRDGDDRDVIRDVVEVASHRRLDGNPQRT